jgi:hypothetical protein
MSLRPLELESDPQVKALRRRIQELELRVHELQKELEEARSSIDFFAVLMFRLTSWGVYERLKSLVTSIRRVAPS